MARTKIKYAPKDISPALIEEKRQAQEYWETRSMSGHPGSVSPGAMGSQMPAEEVALYKGDRDGPGIDYTIVSYATPIGWHIAGRGWRVPQVHYSPTTFGQQRMLRLLSPQVTS